MDNKTMQNEEIQRIRVLELKVQQLIKQVESLQKAKQVAEALMDDIESVSRRAGIRQ